VFSGWIVVYPDSFGLCHFQLSKPKRVIFGSGIYIHVLSLNAGCDAQISHQDSCKQLPAACAFSSAKALRPDSELFGLFFAFGQQAWRFQRWIPWLVPTEALRRNYGGRLALISGALITTL